MSNIFLPLLLCLSLCLFAEYSYNLSICAIFQDEAPYLKEWLEYHRLLGVEHFYLTNHASGDHFREVLQPYIQEGIVELKDEFAKGDDFESFHHIQCTTYSEGLKNARGVSKWVAFLDIDEFVVPAGGQSLVDFLVPYEKYGALGVNWLMFGTSGVKEIPKGRLMIEMLTCCSEKNYANNLYVKSIVRPEHASHFENPHQPVFFPGYFAVNTDRFPFQGKMSDYVLTNKLRINHYWTRDEHFFYNKKIARQKRWGGAPDPEAIFKKMNVNKDELIQRNVPHLRENIFQRE
jgi:hypothetical protein